MRVFLVDDEAPARVRMREVLGDLAAELPHEIVGEAANGADALAALPRAGAQVVLVDIHMPQMSGMEFARHLSHLAGGPAVIFVTAHDQYAVEAFEGERARLPAEAGARAAPGGRAAQGRCGRRTARARPSTVRRRRRARAASCR